MSSINISLTTPDGSQATAPHLTIDTSPTSKSQYPNKDTSRREQCYIPRAPLSPVTRPSAPGPLSSRPFPVEDRGLGSLAIANLPPPPPPDTTHTQTARGTTWSVENGFRNGVYSGMRTDRTGSSSAGITNGVRRGIPEPEPHVDDALDKEVVWSTRTEPTSTDIPSMPKAMRRKIDVRVKKWLKNTERA